MTTHRFKTFPTDFQPVWSGDKPYDVRWDDRAYQPGHIVRLEEWDPAAECKCDRAGFAHRPACEKYTGRWIEATIGHLLSNTAPRGRQPGFRGNGYVVFGLLDIETSDDLPVPTAPIGTPPSPRPSFAHRIADMYVDSPVGTFTPSPLIMATPRKNGLSGRHGRSVNRLRYRSESDGA